MIRPVDLFDRALERIDEFFQRGELRRGLRNLFLAMMDHHSARTASAMAFDLFLAMIPMLAFGGWLFAFALRRDPAAMWTVSRLLELTPLQVHEALEQQIDRFNQAAVAPMVLAGALWVASNAFTTLMSVLEAAVKAPPRPWWQKRLIAIACVFSAFFVLAVSGTVTVLLAGGPTALIGKILGGGAGVAKAAGFLVAAATATVLVAAFFKVAVRRPGVEERIWPGAALTVLIGTAASYGFGLSASRVARYAAFYGSLAAVAFLLAWLWICCAALLLGAEFNAELERPRGVRRALNGPPSLPHKVHSLRED